jgi:hypothetical protein
MEQNKPARAPAPDLSGQRGPGYEAALREIEHQAEHWDTPDHGETGRLIAEALRAAVDIARTGGLKCEHRHSTDA